MSNSKYTYVMLAPIVQKNKSWAGVCRDVGVKPISGSQAYIKSRALSLDIDHSHFTGQAWSRGKTLPCKRKIEYYLKKDSVVSSDGLRKRLIREGIKSVACEKCGLDGWLGNKPPLELDHINSDHFDNRLENLQILCPNCHAIKTSPHIFSTQLRKPKKAKRCIDCKIACTAERCKSCAGKYYRPKKIKWPSMLELQEMLEKSNYLALSKKLGVSDNAIRKHIKMYAEVVEC